MSQMKVKRKAEETTPVQPPPTPPDRFFEYEVVELSFDPVEYMMRLREELNKMAIAGWRLHTIFPPQTSNYSGSSKTRQTLIMERVYK